MDHTVVTHTFNPSTGNIPEVVTYDHNPIWVEVILVYRRSSRLPGRQWWCHTLTEKRKYLRQA